MTAAKKKIPLLKSSFFWNKIADVLGLFGTGGLVTLSIENADTKWTWLVGGITGLVQVIRLLFTDANKNNIPDILEDQEAEMGDKQEVNISIEKDPLGGQPIVEVTKQVVSKDEEK